MSNAEISSTIPRERSWQRQLLRALGIAFAYYLLARVSLLFVTQPEGFAIIWPPSGFILGVLLLIDRRSWPLIMALVFAGITLANLSNGNTLAVSLGFAVANSLEPVIAAYLLGRFAEGRITFTRVRHVVGFVLVSVLASNSLTALVGAAVPALAFGTPFWHAWIQWFIGDGAGMLIVAPLVITLSLEQSSAFRELGLKKTLEYAMLLASLAVVSLFTYGVGFYGLSNILRPYAAYPLLIWAAMRFHGAKAALPVALLAALDIYLTTLGQGPFVLPGSAMGTNVLSLQVYLGIAGLMTWLLSSSIAERDRSNDHLKESERHYRELFENASLGIFQSTLDGKVIIVNPAFAAMFGYESPEEVRAAVRNVATDIFADPQRREEIIRLRAEHPELNVFENRYRRKDGSTFTGRLQIRSVTNADGRVEHLEGFIEDITERKASEDRLFKLMQEQRIILDNAPIGISKIVDRKQVWVNKKTEEMFQYSKDEMADNTTRALYPSQEAYERVGREAYPFLASGKVFETEQQLIRRDGSLIWVRYIGKAIEPSDMSEGTIWLLEDVEERKRAEEQLRRSLEEKTVMLKEIHHRVKNNMQVISSLLNLQAHAITDETVRALFEESRGRIQSMALIHERLYRSEDLAHIDFKEYLQHLVGSISRTFQRPGVAVTVDMESVALDVNAGIPSGLIVNELVANSLKHAFPDGRKGTVSVGITRTDDGGNVLVVSDNGIGFPAGIDFRKTTSLGLQLVNVLSGQIHGTIELDSSAGTKFRISFPGGQRQLGIAN